ncbi:MAG: SUMF1/EgtB/PvdO family nonheme iron enzyme [Deltaproteobacteria bacterium]|nr:SUMF1/EgtB/PvdO family nonheme iron enzyme [Deltaproteobacteria bacterium]
MIAALLPALSSCELFLALGGGAGLPCDSDEACNLGQVCIDRVCRPGVSCVCDADCAAGYSCDIKRQVCVLGTAPNDAGRSDQGAQRDAARDDAAITDAAIQDVAMPDTATTDAALPDAATTDAAMPDTATTDAATHDTATTDAAMPDTAIADVGQRDVWLPPGLTWVPITGGAYEMGCSPNDTCNSDESPRHTVTISAFELTATEVTQQQYQDVIGSNPSYHTGCPSCPVEQVNWQQASDFCAAVGGRLPTEAEWEYAARAGTTTKYYCGDDVACLDGIAWYDSNSDSQSQSVGGKTANAFGLYDMLGNVWEWNADWYDASYYSISPSQDPMGPATGTYRVLRGGSFSSLDGSLHASDRYVYDPASTRRAIGFRCARY